MLGPEILRLEEEPDSSIEKDFYIKTLQLLCTCSGMCTGWNMARLHEGKIYCIRTTEQVKFEDLGGTVGLN